jgi:hypothetical protein
MAWVYAAQWTSSSIHTHCTVSDASKHTTQPQNDARQNSQNTICPSILISIDRLVHFDRSFQWTEIELKELLAAQCTVSKGWDQASSSNQKDIRNNEIHNYREIFELIKLELTRFERVCTYVCICHQLIIIISWTTSTNRYISTATFQTDALHAGRDAVTLL